MENNEKDTFEKLESKELENVAEEKKADNITENDGENITAEDSENCEKKNNGSVSVDDFLSSLEEMAPIDVAPAPSKKEKIKLSYVLRGVLLTIFSAVFVVAVFMIASNYIDGYAAGKMYSDLSDDFFEGVDRTGYMSYLAPAVLDKSLPNFGSPRNNIGDGEFSVVETNNPFTAKFRQKLEEYKAKNPDIYGWMQVDGTNISYACVKGSDNDYYLDHTATLENNVNGAIFADFRCDRDVLNNPNLVFYGHNMIYPSQMFHDLEKYLDGKFFRNNRYVTIYTLDGVYRYEIFAVYQTTSTYRYCQIAFSSDESFVKWCNEMKANSLHSRNTGEFTADTKILTLSTCTNGHIDDRYAIQARLVSVEK